MVSKGYSTIFPAVPAICVLCEPPSHTNCVCLGLVSLIFSFFFFLLSFLSLSKIKERKKDFLSFIYTYIDMYVCMCVQGSG